MNDESAEYEAHFIDAAQRAAPAFGLEPTAVSVMNRSENVVCALTLPDGEQVAMRLHRPGYNTADELRSEVQWVDALAEADIPVPRALPVTNGTGHYSPVDIEIDGQMVEHQVGVVEWVQGEPLGGPLDSDEAADLSHHYRRIGELAAHIRVQSETWTAPPGFVRRRWDVDAFLGDAPLWGRFWEAPVLSGDQRELLTDARGAMVDTLSGSSTGPERFGLIHADLHLGNVMADGDELTLIDFDDAGFGWYAYELAVSLQNVTDQPWYERARAAMFEGYRQVHTFDDDEVQLVDTLLVMRSLMVVGWLTARPELPVYQYLGDVVEDATISAKNFLKR